jgi:hypothetical protein
MTNGHAPQLARDSHSTVTAARTIRGRMQVAQYQAADRHRVASDLQIRRIPIALG